MNSKFLYNLNLLDPEAAAPRSAKVLVEAGKISRIFNADAARPEGAEPVDLKGLALAPGFLDLHFHGELIFASDSELPDALNRTAEALVREGTTGYLATTVAFDDARIRSFVTHCQALMTQPRHDAAELLGVHLEGPWINPLFAGAQPNSAIRPYRATEGNEILEFADRSLKMVTLAPECEGGRELVDALCRANVAASLGHSDARQEDIDACVTGGMTHVTHLFNAMGSMHHREPGVAGWALGDDRVTCDLICDGVHVDPAMVQTASRAKGERLMLITDRIDPPGAAEFGSGPVHNDGTAIRMANGELAGSSLTLARAMRNAQAFGAMTRLEAIAAATLRPAKLLGIENERGTFRRGARADFAVLDDQNQVRETWVAGQCAYRASDPINSA